MAIIALKRPERNRRISTRIPGKSDLAKAFRYALNRWGAFNRLIPHAYLAHIFACIHDLKINRIDELLQWNWKPFASQATAA